MEMTKAAATANVLVFLIGSVHSVLFVHTFLIVSYPLNNIGKHVLFVFASLD